MFLLRYLSDKMPDGKITIAEIMYPIKITELASVTLAPKSVTRRGSRGIIMLLQRAADELRMNKTLRFKMELDVSSTNMLSTPWHSDSLFQSDYL